MLPRYILGATQRISQAFYNPSLNSYVLRPSLRVWDIYIYGARGILTWVIPLTFQLLPSQPRTAGADITIYNVHFQSIMKLTSTHVLHSMIVSWMPPHVRSVTVNSWCVSQYPCTASLVRHHPWHAICLVFALCGTPRIFCFLDFGFIHVPCSLLRADASPAHLPCFFHS